MKNLSETIAELKVLKEQGTIKVINYFSKLSKENLLSYLLGMLFDCASRGVRERRG